MPGNGPETPVHSGAKRAYWTVVVLAAVVFAVIITRATRRVVEDPAEAYAKRAEAQYAAFINRFDIRRCACDILDARAEGRPADQYVRAFDGDVERFAREISAAKVQEFESSQPPEGIQQLEDAHDLLARGYSQERGALAAFRKFQETKRPELLEQGVAKLDQAQLDLIEGMYKIVQYLRQVR